MSLDTELLATVERLHDLTAVNPIRIELSQANFDALAAAVAPKLVKPSATPFGGSFFGPDRASVGGVRVVVVEGIGDRVRFAYRCGACGDRWTGASDCAVCDGTGEVYR